MEGGGRPCFLLFEKFYVKQALRQRRSRGARGRLLSGLTPPAARPLRPPELGHLREAVSLPSTRPVLGPGLPQRSSRRCRRPGAAPHRNPAYPPSRRSPGVTSWKPSGPDASLTTAPPSPTLPAMPILKESAAPFCVLYAPIIQPTLAVPVVQ